MFLVSGGLAQQGVGVRGDSAQECDDDRLDLVRIHRIGAEEQPVEDEGAEGVDSERQIDFTSEVATLACLEQGPVDRSPWRVEHGFGEVLVRGGVVVALGDELSEGARPETAEGVGDQRQAFVQVAQGAAGARSLDSAQAVLEDGEGQAVPVRPAPVDRGLADARPPGHVLDDHAAVSLLVEDLGGRLEHCRVDLRVPGAASAGSHGIHGTVK